MEVKGGHVEAARAKKSCVVSAEPVFQLDSDVVPLANNKGRARQSAVEDKNWPPSSAILSGASVKSCSSVSLKTHVLVLYDGSLHSVPHFSPSPSPPVKFVNNSQALCTYGYIFIFVNSMKN